MKMRTHNIQTIYINTGDEIDSESTIERMQYLCRLCAKENDKLDLIDLYSASMVNQWEILDLCKTYLLIEFDENSYLPCSICTKCINQANEIVEFKNRCQMTQLTFNSLENFNNKAENNIFNSSVLKFDIDDNVAPDKNNSSTNSYCQNKSLFNLPTYWGDSSDDNFFIQETYKKHIVPEVRKRNKKKTYKNLNFDKNGDLQWKCLDCKNNFTSRPKLKTHRKQCKYVGSQRSKRNGKFPCDTCDRVLYTLVGYRLHVHSHELNVARNINRNQNNGLLFKDASTLCFICGRNFTLPGTLKVHLQVHGNQRYECDVCQRKFYIKQCLSNHLYTHINERKYICEICNKAYKSNKILLTHKKTHGPIERLHQCTICSKAFQAPYKLKIHLMTHSGLKPHKCDLCDNSFRFKQSLKKHNTKVHNITYLEHESSEHLIISS